MDYSIELLREERNRLDEELLIAKQNLNWEVIIRNERLLEDLNKAIELLFESN